MSIKYSEDHEWVDVKEDDLVVIGITDFAQEQLGDLVYVELPEVGDECSRGDNISVIESVKAASDIYAPIAGTVVEVNAMLEDSPELVNEKPYADGWFFKIRISDSAAVEGLLTAEQYQALCEAE